MEQKTKKKSNKTTESAENVRRDLREDAKIIDEMGESTETFYNEETPVEETPLEETPVEETTTNKKGVVVCEKLNVRAIPNLKGAIIGVVKKGTKLDILLTESTETFYSVFCEYGAGFCVKEYIKLI